MESKKILIIDDEESFIEPVKFFLEKQGFSVVSVTDGLGGLQAAREEIPDLILLDLMLPGMNGYQVCRLLKFDSKYKEIPIIIISAKDTDEEKSLGKESGSDLYMTKPVNFDGLVEKIKNLVDNDG